MIFNLFKNKKQRGYTLIELMIVIAIIGVLSAVVFVVFSSAREKSRMSNAKMFEANHVGVLRNYLVAEWKFDECSGSTANDSSGSDVHLTLVNSPIWSTNTPTKTGCALDFNGSTQYAYATDNPALDLDDNYTVSAWIYNRNTASKVIMTKSNATYRGPYIGYGFENHGFIFGAHSTSNSPFGLRESYDVNNWNFVVGVVSKGKRSIYVNGKLINDNTTSGNSWNNSLDFVIGSDSSLSYKSNVIVDNTRIYSSYLTATDVQKLYAEESAQRKLAEAK